MLRGPLPCTECTRSEAKRRADRGQTDGSVCRDCAAQLGRPVAPHAASRELGWVACAVLCRVVLWEQCSFVPCWPFATHCFVRPPEYPHTVTLFEPASACEQRDTAHRVCLSTDCMTAGTTAHSDNVPPHDNFQPPSCSPTRPLHSLAQRTASLARWLSPLSVFF